MSITRRLLLSSGLAFYFTPLSFAFAQSEQPLKLRAMKGEKALLGNEQPKTQIWGYEGQVPGPVLRVKQGEKLRVLFENHLEQPSSIHWHGVRLPNNMDGAAGLTQPPVKPQESFLYEFTPPDAGTFWYHPHIHGLTSEQLDRGLYGVLIVDEKNPPQIDQEHLIVMDDWALDEKAQIVGDFGNPHHANHAGRIGSLLLANNEKLHSIAVERFDRLRLRFVNVANSRVLWLKFQNLNPKLIAFDGQPAEVITLKHEQVVLAPGQRADIILDITQGLEEIRHITSFDGKTETPLLRLVAGKNPRRTALLPESTPLLPNPLPQAMNFAKSKRFEFKLQGGAMNHQGHHQHAAWLINGKASHGHGEQPAFSVKKGDVVMLTFINETNFPHNMHVHGHHFRLLDAMDDGWKPYWLDSVLINVKSVERIAFLADNVGKWMLHCHMIEHQESGMALWFEVKA